MHEGPNAEFGLFLWLLFCKLILALQSLLLLADKWIFYRQAESKPNVVFRNRIVFSPKACTLTPLLGKEMHKEQRQQQSTTRLIRSGPSRVRPLQRGNPPLRSPRAPQLPPALTRPFGRAPPLAARRGKAARGPRGLPRHRPRARTAGAEQG